MARIVLIRHGQTVWNRENRFRGQADPELDEVGLNQAVVTAQYVSTRWPVVAVYSSPLRRAIQTAKAVAEAHGLAAKPNDGLLDISFGEWQGLAVGEATRRYPSLLRTWFEAPQSMWFPAGESLVDVRARIVPAVEEIILRHPAESVALVSHTVAIRVLLCSVMGLGLEHFWHLGQDTCAVSVVETAPDGSYALAQLNDTSHLHRL